jgi:hypothetical protein
MTHLEVNWGCLGSLLGLLAFWLIVLWMLFT